MDSQHRHELQQNDLSKLTTKAVPFFKKLGMPLVIGLGVVVVLFLIGVYWFTQTTASTTESWAEFDRVLHQPNASAGDYAELAEKHPATPVAGWARLKEAEDFLKSGLRAAFSNKEVSQSDLKKAEDAFQKLLSGERGVNSDVRERALFGLARSQEALSDGKTDDAIASYQRLLREFPETIFQAIVNERIKALESPQAKDFYAWFHEQKPQPKDPHAFPFKKRVGDVEGGDAMEESSSSEESDGMPSDENKSEDTKPDDDKSDAESKPDSDPPKSEQPESESKPSEDAEKSDSP